jgi:rRNA maturation endonuclease Nob1
MDITDFYNEQKWCEHCKSYVPYLMSVDRSYCARCGNEVTLFNKADWQAFHDGVEGQKASTPAAKKRRKSKAS